MATQLSIRRAGLCLPYLIECAQKGKTITDGELAEKIDSHPRALSHPLDHLLRECLRLGLPTIGTLVVSKTTGLPGDGFIVDQQARQLEYGGSQYKKLVKEEQEQIYKQQNWQPLREAYGLHNSRG